MRLSSWVLAAAAVWCQALMPLLWSSSAAAAAAQTSSSASSAPASDGDDHSDDQKKRSAAAADVIDPASAASALTPLPRRPTTFRGLEIITPYACNALPGYPYGDPTARPAPVRMRVDVNDLVHVQHTIVELTLATGNTVWQYDVPPTPYGTSADVQKKYLCPEVHDSWQACAAQHTRFLMSAQPAGSITPERGVPVPVLQPLPQSIEFQLLLLPHYYRVTAQLVARDTGLPLQYPMAVSHFKLGLPLIPQRAHIAATQIVAKTAAAEEKRAAQRARMERAAAEYRPKHPELFAPGVELAREWLAPELLSALADGSRDSLLKLLTPQSDSGDGSHTSGIYSFPLFTRAFCRLLIDEIEHMQQYPQLNERPNTMNSYGAVLDDFGLQPLMDDLRVRVVAPLAALVFPEWSYGGLDHHHAFAIKYKRGEDETLAFHMDESEVTLNVCLGKEGFTGGNVFFNGQRDTERERREEFEFAHVPGVALLHVGQHWHGARRIDKGERYNIILWARSTAYHRSPMEQYVATCNADELKGRDEILAPGHHGDEL